MDINLSGLFRDSTVRDWIYSTRRSYTMMVPMPVTDRFIATARSNVHLKTLDDVPLCTHKQSASKAAQRLVGPIFAKDIASAKAWNKPLCQVCLYVAAMVARMSSDVPWCKKKKGSLAAYRPRCWRGGVPL